MAVEQPGAYSPLLVHGPTGTGKTHLLEGHLRGISPSRVPAPPPSIFRPNSSPARFCSRCTKAAWPVSARKYRELELLVIDDLQFLANKKATIGELQHTIDTLLRAGRQLVFAADRSPAALKSLGPELVSRLSGGMVCRLEPPEYATRLGIVRTQAARLAARRARRRAGLRGLALHHAIARVDRRPQAAAGHEPGPSTGRSRWPWPKRRWPN